MALKLCCVKTSLVLTLALPHSLSSFLVHTELVLARQSKILTSSLPLPLLLSLSSVTHFLSLARSHSLARLNQLPVERHVLLSSLSWLTNTLTHSLAQPPFQCFPIRTTSCLALVAPPLNICLCLSLLCLSPSLTHMFSAVLSSFFLLLCPVFCGVRNK